ncbi:hypothetical protein F5Y19DRAFT_477635 [Xylariaceae sp. FL1651]|nr:hypothetical protein F5Y19DRAFT_477635 [Xylariaceae sp. FL1651]
MTKVKDMSKTLQDKAIAQIANASTLLRKAISAAIPGGKHGQERSTKLLRARNGLVLKKAKVRDGDPVNPIRSPGEAGYDSAMKYLTTPVEWSRQTPVEIYIEKQMAWADAQDAWDKAKIKAQNEAKAKNPNDVIKQGQDYNEWSQANYRKLKADEYVNFYNIFPRSVVAERKMDWVSNGHKYNVEFNFGIVDTVSIMARVENSKEPMRNSTIMDADGANEMQGSTRYGAYSLEQADAETARLNRLRLSYQTLQQLALAQPPSYPVSDPKSVEPRTTVDASDLALKDNFSALYFAEAALAKQSSLLRLKSTGDQAALTEAAKKLLKARKDLDKQVKSNMKIKKLKEKRTLKEATQPLRVPAIAGASNEQGSVRTIVAAEGTELADPRFGVALPDGYPGAQAGDKNAGQAINSASASTGPGTELDPWVTILASFSAEDQQNTSSTNSWGMTVGGGAGWGLWSVGGSYAHDESKSDSQMDMASCDVSVTLRRARRQHQPALAGVDVGSANPSVLGELAQYNSSPSFPTSFIVAANTALEFHGNTQHVEDHFSAQSTSGSISVDWGPFSVSSSFHQSSSKQDHQMQATATGCKTMFGAPQVIGWVSQILLALPRQKGLEPMVQNMVVPHKDGSPTRH